LRLRLTLIWSHAVCGRRLVLSPQAMQDNELAALLRKAADALQTQDAPRRMQHNPKCYYLHQGFHQEYSNCVAAGCVPVEPAPTPEPDIHLAYPLGAKIVCGAPGGMARFRRDEVTCQSCLNSKPEPAPKAAAPMFSPEDAERLKRAGFSDFEVVEEAAATASFDTEWGGDNDIPQAAASTSIDAPTCSMCRGRGGIPGMTLGQDGTWNCPKCHGTGKAPAEPTSKSYLTVGRDNPLPSSRIGIRTPT